MNKMERRRNDMWGKVTRNWVESGPQFAWMIFSMFSISFGMLAVLLLNRGWAAPIPGQHALKESWPQAMAAKTCRGEHRQLFFSGEFTHPSTAARLTLSVGRDASGEPVSAMITGSGRCEAICQVTRFERYSSDLKPAFMDLSCEGNAMASLRMPLQISWERRNQDPLIRLGSVITGIEEALMKVAVDRYQISKPAAPRVAELH